MNSLTGQAHQWLQSRLRPDHHAFDGTEGNGNDTLFLANRCCHGQVFCFDVQPAAIRKTRQLLQTANRNNVHYYEESHAHLITRLPREFQGNIAAFMLNLGYLPGGDHSQITQPETTLSALNQAWEVLSPDGIFSVIAYTGHPGGLAEANVVAAWFQQQAEQGHWGEFHCSGLNPPAPVWFCAAKRQAN